jgi:DNA polymerase-3 subunit beta
MIKINNKNLSDVLSVIQPVCNGRIMPILGSVKIECDSDNGRLRLVGSNSEMQIESYCDAEFIGNDIDNHGGCIDADKLNKFVRANSSERIELTMGSDSKAILKGKSRSTINVLNNDDFPEMKVDLDKSIVVKLSAVDLAIAFDSVSHCVAINDVRNFLNGVSFKLNNGELSVVGSDGFRLSTVTIPVNVDSSLSIDCIIPLKTAQTIAKSFKHGDIELRLNRSSLSVTDGETTIIGKNIDAKFPDFGKILNVERVNHLSVNRADLLSGVESVLLTATDQIKKIQLTLSIDNINIVCSNQQGEQSETDIECEYNGTEMVFGVNADYLLQSSKKIDGVININWADENSLILTATDDETTQHLLMPIRM